MNNPLVTAVTVLACVAVAVILFMGLWNMLKGGDNGPAAVEGKSESARST